MSVTIRAVVHQMRNHLAVAVASVEAFIDGKLEPTHRRLHTVLEALAEVEALLDDLRAAVETESAAAGDAQEPARAGESIGESSQRS